MFTTHTRPHRGQFFTDAAEDLWFPAHQSTGDSFLRVRGPDGGASGPPEDPEDDGIGLPSPRGGGGGRRKSRKGNVSVSPWIWGTLCGVAAFGIIVTLARKDIAAELTEGWLKGQGIPARVKFDTLSLSHVSGQVVAGNAVTSGSGAPDLDTGHFDADFSLNLFASGGQPLVRLKNLHAAHSVLYAGFKNGKLNFGTLDKLVQDSLNAPPSAAQPPAEIVLEDAVLNLRSDYGLIRGRGGLSMRDGRLTYLSLKLPATHLRGAAGEGTIDAGRITAQAAGSDQLEVHALIDAPDWTVSGTSAEDAATRLHGVSLELDAHVPYARTGPAFAGPLQGTMAIKADGAQSPAADVSHVDADLRFSGRLNKDLSLAATGTLTGGTGAVHDGGLSANGAHLDLDGLSLATGASGVQAGFKGRVALIKARSSGLSFDTAAATVSGTGHSGNDGGWAVDVTSDIRGDGGRYDGLDAMVQARRVDPQKDKSKDGPVDGIVALDRAFQRFSLRAKGLRVRMAATAGQAPQLDVRLGAPVQAQLNGGGSITLTPQAGKPLLATGQAGGFAITLSGRDLPQAAVTVTKFGLTPLGTLSGAYELSSRFNMDPVTGAAIEAHGGFASTAAGGFDVTLDAPAKVTAQAVDLGDHFETVSATISQTGAAFFSATAQGWRVTGGYSALSLTAPNESVTLTGAEGPLDVFSQNGSDQLGLKMAMLSGTLGDALPEGQQRFNPLILSGTLTQDTRFLTGRFKTVIPRVKRPDGSPVPIATISLDNDARANKGSLSFNTVGLDFAPQGLQPVDLSPQVAAVLTKNVTGKATFGGAFDWAGDQASSHGVLKVDIASFEGTMGAGQGLKGEIDFTSLAPLRTDPGQTFGLDHLAAVVPLDHFTLSTQFLGDHIAVEKADVLTPGGQVTLEPTNIPLDGTSPISGALTFNGLDFGKVIAVSSLAQNMTFEGRLSGRIPFSIIGGDVTFVQGTVAADGPGRISIKRSGVTDVSASGSLSASNGAAAGAAAQPAFNPFQDMAFQAMEYIHYDQLDAKVNSLADKTIDINFHLKGKFDPPQKQKATISFADYISGKWMQKPIKLPSDTPVELYLDVPVHNVAIDLGQTKPAADALTAKPVVKPAQ